MPEHYCKLVCSSLICHSSHTDVAASTVQETNFLNQTYMDFYGAMYELSQNILFLLDSEHICTSLIRRFSQFW